jgi:hypothetical protein
MNPDLEKLIALQEADREIARLNEEVATLPRRVAAIEAKLAGTRARVEAARAAVKAGENNRRKFESQISDLRQKISKYRDQSLEVKTNEQYRALMHEIEFAQRDIGALEDKILEIMLDAESREKEIKELEVELKAEMAEIEKEKAEAHARTAEDEQQLATWNAQRSQLRSGIQEYVLRHYDRVRQFRGSGIAEVIGHKCAACQVMLRPQVFNDVKNNDQIVSCDSCQRLLYFIPEHQPAEEPAATNGRGRRAPQKAWYYLPDFRSGMPTFAAFVNGNRNCSMRAYDAESGQKLEPTDVQPGEFKAAFSQWLREGTRLRAMLHEEHLEEWGEQLPEAELTNLKAALHEAQAAEAEAAAQEQSASEKEEPAPQA